MSKKERKAYKRGIYETLFTIGTLSFYVIGIVYMMMK